MIQESPSSSSYVLGVDVGKKNFALCLLNEQLTILAWKNISIGKSFPFHTFSQNMVKQLDIFLLPYIQEDPENTRTWTLAIENPPTFKNPMLRAIACSFIMYFTMRYGKPFTLKWWNARDIHNIVVHNILPKGITYKERKENAIRACFQYVQESCWLDTLQQNKKKDDLCDAYLVARAESLQLIGWNEGNLQLIANPLPCDVGTPYLVRSFQEREKV
jgi:hypothetical protein